MPHENERRSRNRRFATMLAASPVDPQRTRLISSHRLNKRTRCLLLKTGAGALLLRFLLRHAEARAQRLDKDLTFDLDAPSRPPVRLRDVGRAHVILIHGTWGPRGPVDLAIRTSGVRDPSVVPPSVGRDVRVVGAKPPW